VSATSEAVERLEQLVAGAEHDAHRSVDVPVPDLRAVVDLASMLLPELRLHARALADSLEGDLGLARLVLERLDDYGVQQ
jgi:hypothetical protein